MSFLAILKYNFIYDVFYTFIFTFLSFSHFFVTKKIYDAIDYATNKEFIEGQWTHGDVGQIVRKFTENSLKCLVILFFLFGCLIQFFSTFLYGSLFYFADEIINLTTSKALK